MNKQFQKGFSLLELVLVVGVGATVGFIKFQDMKTEQENVLASAVGQQMKQMGEAVNGYINIRYDKLSTLSNAAENGSDPGPRMCSGSVCEITYMTLINEGLLPSSFTGLNAQKSAYKIILKRDGISPNYVINGLITTTLPWSEGSKMRYDLLGKAMLSAGIDSGMTKSATVASGYEAQWSEKASDFRNITAEGLLAYRTGFDSTMYTVYLRRDGTLPMTGDLNMGGKNIGNAKNITATASGDFGGDISSGGNIISGKQLIGHNGGGDTFYIGGGDANDYEFRLGSIKPLTLWRSGGVSNEQRLQVWGRQDNVGDLSVRGDGNSQGYIIASGNITSSETVSGKYLKANSISVAGASCPSNGMISQNSEGTILSCVNGQWKGIGSKGYKIYTGNSGKIALATASDHLCSILSWRKYGNSRTGAFYFTIENGRWYVKNNGEYIQVLCTENS
ncbi:shufflon system plasmid conjugative transfer pilus tip adhesin PilV [Pectobacterium sp. A535-S3-A17]|nr:shufflon system plasmid conjugative transfer pilus tip adhesin PilV [Pectobacterium quasiaquaticum]MBE5212550.1 shufflon system plasmid conjugative transfer pilus tip adhesin PilV [Pectobacterium quasiaquaticum]MBE5225644.1 shufflon system plasmid conjugative transfer pilus tip adhesin PilV [Pectobacterium quasiaquaticum]